MTDTDLRRQLHETRAALLEELTLTAKLRRLCERSDRQCGEAIQVAKDLRDLLVESQRRFAELQTVARGLADTNRELVEIIKGAKAS